MVKRSCPACGSLKRKVDVAGNILCECGNIIEAR